MPSAVTRKLIELQPSIKALLISGYSEEAVSKRGVVMPEMAFLSKPVSTDLLTKKIRSILDTSNKRLQIPMFNHHVDRSGRGYEVSLAQDGRKAWEFFDQSHYKIVISHWMMELH